MLEGGFEEPVYLAGTSVAGEPARIRYTRDYFRSALHEVAHWCVAGPRRRRLDDYGYWYAPDGRDAAAQAEFLRVEVRPQALEALFCAACNHPFRVSLDTWTATRATKPASPPTSRPWLTVCVATARRPAPASGSTP